MRTRFLAAALILAAIWPTASWSAPPGWPASLTIGTASPGGVYVLYGETVASILTEALGIPVSAQATQGSVQNILLLESGNAQLGLVISGIALQSWDGSGTWTHDKKLQSMRALFPMYGVPIDFVALKTSAIRSLHDMAGKAVAVGPAGGAGATYAAKMFHALGIQTTLRYGAYETQGTQMQSGLFEALVTMVATPGPALTELDQSGQIGFVPVSGDEIAKLRSAMPELSPSVVPARAYPSIATDYPTVGLYSFVVGSKDLPDDLAYAIVKAVYAGHERLVKVVPAARETVAENAKNITVVPYHPGALRYYREIGVEIPDALAKSTAQ